MTADYKLVGLLALCAMVVSAGSYPAASTASIKSKDDADAGLTTSSAGTGTNRLERVNERLRQMIVKFIKSRQPERSERMDKVVADLLAYRDRLPFPPSADQLLVADEVSNEEDDSRKEDDDSVDLAPEMKRASAAWDMDYGWGGGRFGKRRDRLGLAGRFGRSVPQQRVAKRIE